VDSPQNLLADLQAADPAALERLYRQAHGAGRAAEFRAALQAAYAAAPDNVLYAAWHYRLQDDAPDRAREQRAVPWAVAVVISLITGLSLWLLSGDEFTFGPNGLPYLFLLAAPLIGLAVMLYLRAAARTGYGQALAFGLGLAALTAYAFWLALDRPSYRDLMAPHLFLLAWVAVGLSLVGVRPAAREVFAFLIKSIEAVVTGGVYLIASLIFATIALAMFRVLSFDIPDSLNRLLYVGTAGLVPVLAIASIYDPHLPPAQQDFQRGVGRLIITFPRILLGLSLVVLVAYVISIPFNFMAPFTNRDVLITYNGMLFAIMGLLVGATPVAAPGLAPRSERALRLGIQAVAGLVILISLYALAAVLYRTFNDVLTINRLTVIGWNLINLGLLIWLLIRQRQAAPEAWIEALHGVFALGGRLYLGWALFITLATPWLF